MIHDFPQWSTSISEASTFSELAGATLAIEANWLLEQLLYAPATKEPLLSALGGSPFGLGAALENCLQILKAAEITPVFVFNGLSIHDEYKSPESLASAAAARHSDAWNLYHTGQPDAAVDIFGSPGNLTIESLYPLVQRLLRQHDVQFLVAPYKSWAQLAYMSSLEGELIDAVAGSSEILMFGIDRLITSLDFEQQEFVFVRREACVQDTGASDHDMFVDAALLSGTQMLPPLPMLGEDRRPFRLRQAFGLMKGHGLTGISVCLNFQEDSRLRQADYLNRFRKNRLAIKHHVVLLSDGTTTSLDAENLPNDSQEFLGPRFPEELYYYLSIGIINARPINQLAAGRIFEDVPLEGGSSAAYRQLFRDALLPAQIQTLALLSKPLHRAYQYREITAAAWFSSGDVSSTKLNELQQGAESTKAWNVPDTVLDEIAPPLSIWSLVKTLINSDFTVTTVTARKVSHLLSSRNELLANTFWRYLHLRGYMDNQSSTHRLGDWGFVLGKALSTLPPAHSFSSSQIQAVVLGVELLRLGVLSNDAMFDGETSSAGSFTLLIARVASLGRLLHQPVGYTGPLYRNLLAWTTLTNSVRQSCRDLLDVTLTTMLLSGDVDRLEAIPSLAEVSQSLPFAEPIDCASGILVKHYLDELLGTSTLDPETKSRAKGEASKKAFPHVNDFETSLNTAWELWDALYAAARIASDLRVITDASHFEQANAWLKDRR